MIILIVNAIRNRILIIVMSLSLLATLGASEAPQTLTLSHKTYLPLTVNANAFFYATSRYMSTTSTTTLQNLGCAQGRATPSGATALVILDFGQPAYLAQTGAYGAWIFGTYAFRSLNDITLASEAFLNSFYLCSPAGAYLRLVVGTVNYGSDVTSGHGAAWAAMINNIAAWIVEPPSIASKVTVRGGNDMEPSFGAPSVTRAWVDGYTSVYTGTSYLYNYGSCDGCPYKACTGCTPNNGWTLDDVWYVSWGAKPAWPVPEIYLTNGVHADQWYRMSLYSYTQHGQAFDFKGSLTQWQACQTNGPCPYLDNTPVAGWTQLYSAVNADSRTRQNLGLASDISWGN